MDLLQDPTLHVFKVVLSDFWALKLLLFSLHTLFLGSKSLSLTHLWVRVGVWVEEKVEGLVIKHISWREKHLHMLFCIVLQRRLVLLTLINLLNKLFNNLFLVGIFI